MKFKSSCSSGWLFKLCWLVIDDDEEEKDDDEDISSIWWYCECWQLRPWIQLLQVLIGVFSTLTRLMNSRGCLLEMVLHSDLCNSWAGCQNSGSLWVIWGVVVVLLSSSCSCLCSSELNNKSLGVLWVIWALLRLTLFGIERFLPADAVFRDIKRNMGFQTFFSLNLSLCCCSNCSCCWWFDIFAKAFVLLTHRFAKFFVSVYMMTRSDNGWMRNGGNVLLSNFLRMTFVCLSFASKQ